MMTRFPRRLWILLALVAIIPFAQTLSNPPVLDDGWAVVDNPLVQGGLKNAVRIFTSSYNYGGTETTGGLFRPFTTLTFAANYAVHARHPFGYHFVNLILHVVASLLVFFLALRLAEATMPSRAPWVAIIAGVLFAVHPAHVEAVAPIVGRKELLSAIFALSALITAFSGCGLHRSMKRFVATVTLLALGILSNEGTAVTPLLYAIIAFAIPQAAGISGQPALRNADGRRALIQIAAVSSALFLSLLPYLILHGMPRGVPLEAQWFAGIPRSTVFYTTARILAEYMRILSFPAFLGTDFAYAARVQLIQTPGIDLFLAISAWLPLLIVSLSLLRRYPLPSAGILWFFTALLPVLHIFPIGVLMAERLLYLPSVGFCIAAGALIGSIRRTPAVVAVTLILVVSFGIRSAIRSADWGSDVALWESELPKAPLDVVVNNNLAVAYSARGEFAKAMKPLETAIRVAPRYWRAYVNMGIAAQGLRDLPLAHKAFLQAIQIAPKQSAPYFFYAKFLADQGDLDRAIDMLTRARYIAPEEARIATAQGQCLTRLGRTTEARAAFKAALAIDPANAEAQNGLIAVPTGAP
jgi:tetratricopeptide (TPR) repeat protein